MDLTRIHRMLRLITVMQTGTSKSAVELAAELNVSRRTLFRDLAALQAAGIPYAHDPAHGYRIDPQFFLPPVNLKVNEALGLLLLAKSAEKQRHQPFFRPAVDAVQKLAAVLPAPYREVTADMLNHVSFAPGSTALAAGQSDHFIQLQRAIDRKLVCRMSYDSLFEGEGLIDTELHPYHLHFAVRAWYAIGHSSLHKQIRTFKLARIRKLALTARHYKLARAFHLEDYLGNAWSLIPGDKTYEVELEFSAKVGRNVSEVRWHDSQQHDLLDDGRCIMRFTVDGIDEIAWWLLGYGDEVLVRKPKALREKLCEVYQSALTRNHANGKRA